MLTRLDKSEKMKGDDISKPLIENYGGDLTAYWRDMKKYCRNIHKAIDSQRKVPMRIQELFMYIRNVDAVDYSNDWLKE